MPLSIGQVLSGRYRVDALLGQGGFGAVYRVWDINLNRPRALKENLDASAEAQRQFGREAGILADLAHTNLPRVLDYFFIPSFGQYLVMDFVEGEDLQSILNRTQRALPETQVIAWITQICDALAYLHEQHPPVVHRDVKLANIKITATGKAVLVDFGIAKFFDVSLKTTLGAKAVTPGYSPPEQYGQGQTDTRSDIYSLGATMYALLTGQEPIESVARFSGQTLKPPRAFNPSISLRVEAVILKAMKLDPAERYQRVDELRRDLVGASRRQRCALNERQKAIFSGGIVVVLLVWAAVLLAMSNTGAPGGATIAATATVNPGSAPLDTPTSGSVESGTASPTGEATSTLQPTTTATLTPVTIPSARTIEAPTPTTTAPTASAVTPPTETPHPPCKPSEFWDPVMNRCRSVEGDKPPTGRAP